VLCYASIGKASGVKSSSESGGLSQKMQSSMISIDPTADGKDVQPARPDLPVRCLTKLPAGTCWTGPYPTVLRDTSCASKKPEWR
jgi:hypothetical protein